MSHSYPSTSAADTGTTAGSAADQVKEQVGEQAARVQQSLGEQARSQVAQRSDQAAEQARSVADSARSVADSLDEKGNDSAAGLVRQVADRGDQVADYLAGNDADTILRDVEAQARERPWAVALGAFVVGFAASRVLKASGSRRAAGPAAAPRALPSRPGPVRADDSGPEVHSSAVSAGAGDASTGDRGPGGTEEPLPTPAEEPRGAW